MLSANVNPNMSHRYPATSSAFSASAHPHEDWTKISDLAERRRIQNRIAQRNYRKKLKKRLEDLEKKSEGTPRDGESSGENSPEQQPRVLPVPRNRRSRSSQSSSISSHGTQPSSYDAQSPPSGPILNDGLNEMFGEPLTIPGSTSPAPQFSPFPNPSVMSYYTPYSTAQYGTMASSVSYSESAPYSYSSSYTTAPQVDFTPKTEWYTDSEYNPFGVTYGATQPALELPQGIIYNDTLPQTPPLDDCFDSVCSSSKSPEESSFFPHTPESFSLSPSLVASSTF